MTQGFTTLIVGGELKDAEDKRWMHYFNTELSPSAERTTKSMNSRWSEMESTYKYPDFFIFCLFLLDISVISMQIASMVLRGREVGGISRNMSKNFD